MEGGETTPVAPTPVSGRSSGAAPTAAAFWWVKRRSGGNGHNHIHSSGGSGSGSGAKFSYVSFRDGGEMGAPDSGTGSTRSSSTSQHGRGDSSAVCSSAHSDLQSPYVAVRVEDVFQRSRLIAGSEMLLSDATDGGDSGHGDLGGNSGGDGGRDLQERPEPLQERGGKGALYGTRRREDAPADGAAAGQGGQGVGMVPVESGGVGALAPQPKSKAKSKANKKPRSRTASTSASTAAASKDGALAEGALAGFANEGALSSTSLDSPVGLAYDSFISEPPIIPQGFASPTAGASREDGSAQVAYDDSSSSEEDDVPTKGPRSSSEAGISKQWAAMQGLEHHHGVVGTVAGNGEGAGGRGMPWGRFVRGDGGGSQFAHLRSYEWLEDDSVAACMTCERIFEFFNRRHHCRCCGGIFCGKCSPHMLLVQDPISAPKREWDPSVPHRVCAECERELIPYQEEMIATISHAQRVNLMDYSSPWRFFNSPLAFSLAHEIRKASNSLENVCAGPDECPPTLIRALGDQSIPLKLLHNAKGLIIVTSLRVGALYSTSGGTGLCVARLRDGTWSAPAAIAMGGLGWGAQLGICLTDCIICLESEEAVEMLAGAGVLSLGADAGMSLGLVGRAGEIALNLGSKARSPPTAPSATDEEAASAKKLGNSVSSGSGGDPELSVRSQSSVSPFSSALSSSYSLSKGLFLGMGVEGRVIVPRAGVNRCFYGTEVSVRDILSGKVPQPPAGLPLYRSLNRMERRSKAAVPRSP